MSQHRYLCPRCEEGTVLFEVIRYVAGDPGSRSGPPDSWTAPEPAELEFDFIESCGNCKLDDLDDLSSAQLLAIEDFLLDQLHVSERDLRDARYDHLAGEE